MIKIILLLFFMASTSFAKDFEKGPLKGDAPWSALIILHDIWGLDNFVKREVERYAENGFYVYAIDYYSGTLPADLQSAQRFKDKLTRDDLLLKIKRTFDKLSKNKKIDKKRIGILGWGYGGSLALRSAIQNPELRTIVMSYGDPVVEVPELKKIKAKGLALFAEKDFSQNLTNIGKFKAALSEAHLSFDTLVLPNAKYGFFDYTRTENFNPKSSEEGKKLILGFLKKHLSLTDYVK